MVMARRQVLVQLSDELVASLDERAARRGVSRSELVRRAVEAYVTSDEDAEIDRAIVEGYRRIPQEDDSWSDGLLDEQLAEESW